MVTDSELIVGLDIGTTKVCAVVGEVFPDGAVKIVGIGDSPSKGLRKGMVVNIEDTVKSIRKAVTAAGLMAGCEIRSVYVGIAGGHIMGLNSHGVIAVQGNEVTKRDVDRVLEAAKAVAIPSDRSVIHILPQEYMVDTQRGIADPIGMAGVRLEVNVHIVTGSVSSAQNIVRSCDRAGLIVNDIALESLASAKAILTDEEREIGVALVDIGGGTCDIAIFENNSIKHTAVIPLGGLTLTNDISFGLRTSVKDAEKIKVKYGCALRECVQGDETIEVPSVGGRAPQKMSRMVLAEICEPRMKEILRFVNKTIANSGCRERIRAGVVLTGGASLIEGCVELAEDIFGMPTRIGLPRNIGGLTDVVNHPKFSTVVGLLRYGAEQIAKSKEPIPAPPQEPSSPEDSEEPVTPQQKEQAEHEKGFWGNIVARMKSWFDIF